MSRFGLSLGAIARRATNQSGTSTIAATDATHNPGG